jgi:Na+/H+ antiporter NhaC
VAAPVQPVAFARSFQYPMAFLLPIVLLAGAVFFGRLFTRDATPVRPAP